MEITQMASEWDRALTRLDIRTPTYVYSKAMLERNWRVLTDLVSPARVLVSLKANPNASLTEHLSDLGASFDVSSGNEINGLLSASHSRHPFWSLVGPGKSRELLAQALSARAPQIVLESEKELQRVAQLLERGGADDTSDFLVRINPAAVTVAANEVMGGVPSQFGVDEDQLPSFLTSAKKLGVPIRGLHCFLGSQILSVEQIASNSRVVLKMVDIVRSHIESLERVCLGGGFGVPNQADQPSLDMKRVGRTIRDAADELVTQFGTVDTQVEAGRFVYASAGVYVASVIEIKQSFGKRFVVLDCGMSGFSRPAVRWGEAHPMWLLGEGLASEGQEYSVVGPTCMPGDLMGTSAFTRTPREGDLLVVGHAGAYGYSMSMRDWGSVLSVGELTL